MSIIRDFKAMIQFKTNPIIEDGVFRYEFYKEKVVGAKWSLSADGPENDTLDERTWNHYGWRVSCIDKTNPLADVEMLDEINGFPVDDATECFKECQNLVSVKHIAIPVLESCEKKQFPEIILIYEGEYVKSYTTKNSEMFKDSGLTKVPEQLNGTHANCFNAMMKHAPKIDGYDKLFGPQENNIEDR